jgi:hypothetical protein
MSKIVSRGVFGLAITLYVASLMLPAFSCPNTTSPLGYEVLLTGWLGIIALDPRWIANVGFLWFVIATLFTKVARPPLWLFGAMALLALFSFAPAAGCGGAGGAPGVSKGLALGGYLWVAAMALVLIVGLSRSSDASS